MMQRDTRPLLALLALLAAIGLVAGLSAGMARLGQFEPAASLADRHAVFVLCGFFGTLICLERAVATGWLAALAIPAASAAAGALLWFDPLAAGLLFVLAGIGLAGLTVQAALVIRSLFAIVLVVGAVLWPMGTLWWLVEGETTAAGYIWLGFLILTITAERIELSRLRAPSPASQAALAAILFVFCLSLLGGEPLAGSSWLLALSLFALAVWLLANDIALITVQGRGLARFSAIALLGGYGWMIVAAAGLLLLPPSVSSAGHDLYVHAIGLGFVLSMVFAHAPIILPSVTGVDVRYSAPLYIPLLLLHVATALRAASDLTSIPDLRSASAWLTLFTLALYVLLLARTIGRKGKHKVAAGTGR